MNRITSQYCTCVYEIMAEENSRLQADHDSPDLLNSWGKHGASIPLQASSFLLTKHGFTVIFGRFTPPRRHFGSILQPRLSINARKGVSGQWFTIACTFSLATVSWLIKICRTALKQGSDLHMRV